MAAHRDEEHEEFGEEANSLWRIAFAPTIWAAQFVLAYAATAVVCAKVPHALPAILGLRLGIAAITLAALAAIAWIGWRAWAQWNLSGEDSEEPSFEETRHAFLGEAGFLLSLISFVAVIYVSLPAIFVRTCN